MFLWKKGIYNIIRKDELYELQSERSSDHELCSHIPILDSRIVLMDITEVYLHPSRSTGSSSSSCSCSHSLSITSDWRATVTSSTRATLLLETPQLRRDFETLCRRLCLKEKRVKKFPPKS